MQRPKYLTPACGYRDGHPSADANMLAMVQAMIGKGNSAEQVIAALKEPQKNKGE